MLSSSEYRVLSIRMVKMPAGGSQLEIHLEGPSFPSDSIVAELRAIAHKRHGEDVKIKIRMTLARDVTVETDNL